MSKIWQSYAAAPEDFFAENDGLSPVMAQLLYNRGLKNEEEIEAFLDPESGFNDPFLFKDMEAAVNLLIDKIKAGEKIIVYGDYDADGITAAAVLMETLRILKAKVEVYLPDRVSEGYGLNRDALDQVIAAGAKLVITVDTGIRNKEEVAYAKSKGLQVIITDHHTLPENEEDLPDCLIINPADRRNAYPFRFLAGVGTSFKVASAIVSRSKLSDEQKHYLLERLLDLVAIGTVADMVTLMGENRTLVSRGLEVLNNTKRPGLQELIKVSKLDALRRLESWNIGFQIGPRLNAASRMDHANNAFALLICEDKQKAEVIAKELNTRNGDRQKITETAVGEARAQIDKQFAAGEKFFLAAVSDSEKIWSEGIIGLVAGKICERYYRPTIVVTHTEDGFKGSGRSIEEFNLIEAIEEAAASEDGLVDKYGGHPMACGFSLLSQEKLDRFVLKLEEISARKLKGINLVPKIKIEAEIPLSAVNEGLLAEISLLSPFGQNNPQPKFSTHGLKIIEAFYMGIDGQHVKFRLADEEGFSLWAISFGGTETYKHCEVGDFVDLAFFAEWNDFNGRREIQLKIIDLKKI
ncbi:MAG: single-stranded-DNA-specific exonuclease RecJ [Candidatus Falkowbacteria bacterium]|nr:single-stranded-DNA-specific exonuclease RecJ [Candidatus Falkowbacteria bacterium]